MTLSVAAGASATSAFVNQIAPQGVVKPTNQSLTSNTTLQNDNDLLYALNVANATYAFVMFLDYEAANGGDLKIGFTVPAGATLRLTPNYLSGTVAVTWNELTQANTTYIARGNGAGAANSVGTTMLGSLVVGSTTGTLQLQWAQGTSNATSTIVHAGSVLTLWRLS